MDLANANLMAMLVTVVVAVTIGLWYVAPAVRSRPLGSALIVLLWFHAFRHIAMQIFSASDVGGLDATEGAQRAIAYGELATAILALAAMWAIRTRAPVARGLAWLVAVDLMPTSAAQGAVT